jgi:hypothetical protein
VRLGGLGDDARPRVTGRHLSTIGAQELLGSTSAAHLAYVEKDGTPRGALFAMERCRAAGVRPLSKSSAARWTLHWAQSMPLRLPSMRMSLMGAVPPAGVAGASPNSGLWVSRRRRPSCDRADASVARARQVLPCGEHMLVAAV